MSDDGQKLIHLAFENRNLKQAGVNMVLACGRCNNKTYILEVTKKFPRVVCAVCGMLTGHCGWVDPGENSDDRDPA